MPNIGKERLAILEPYREEFESLYSYGVDMEDIKKLILPALTAIGIPEVRHRKYIRDLASFWGIGYGENAPQRNVPSVNVQLANERQKRLLAEKKYRELEKQSAIEERLIETLKLVIQASDNVEIDISVKEKSSSNKAAHTLVALLSDLHVGEVVDSGAVSGLDEYNIEVFERRIVKWAENLIYLAKLKRAELYVPNLEIFCLGDFVSGEIHKELTRTNEVHIIEQVYHATAKLSKVLQAIAPYFENITLVCCSGNHGRTQEKPYYKNKQDMSFDYLVYQMLSLILCEQENIQFIIPKSFFAYRKVLNTRFIAMHGDGIKGVLGLPYYGIARARARLSDILGVDTPFDHLLLGHFHHYYSCDLYTINGALKGADEYSVGGIIGASRPSQVLMTIHPKYGIVSTEQIFVDDNISRKPVIEAPPTWGELIYGDKNE